MRLHLWLLIATIHAGAACSKSPTKPTPPPEVKRAPSAQPAPNVAPSTSAEGANGARAAPALEEASVRALLDDWLDAQNRGDFSAYERLYAEPFTGVKRSGAYQATFDRRGWLADRRGMFTHAMRVSVKDVQIALVPSGAVVTMEQRWATGNYEDVGKKQMVVVPAPQGPRIAREEMLTSIVEGAEARPKTTDLVLLHPDGLVLDTSPKDSWVSGSMPPVSPHYVVRRAVNEAALPPKLAAWKGKAVHTIGVTGETCETKVTGFTIRAQVYPHFGMEAEWSGRDGGPRLDDVRIAGEVWKLSENGGRALIGELAPSCGGLWALDAAKTPPISAAPEPAPPALHEAALRAFRASAAYRRIQADYVKSQPKAQGLWENYDGGTPDVVAFRFADRTALVYVRAGVERGCADFSAHLGALFGVKKGTSAALELLDTTSAERSLAAFDLEGDGSLEVLFEGRGGDERALWRRQRAGAALESLFSVPNLDCGC